MAKRDRERPKEKRAVREQRAAQKAAIREARRNAEAPAAPVVAPPPAPDGAGEDEATHLLHTRRAHVVKVDQPLVLISQAQRSGGTLLARLFDGHPQCHVHPFELHIGYPRRVIWPELGLHETPAAWFAKLQEKRLLGMFKNGVSKHPSKDPHREASADSFPFLLPPSFQRSLFTELVDELGEVTSERQILDCYMTSLFNGWLDNQNLYPPDKRWVVAFAPRLAWDEGRERFFGAYPDGRLISILRDPYGWMTSARGRLRVDSETEDPELLAVWKRSAGEMLKAAEEHGEQTYIVGFDELINDTEGTMRALSAYLGLDYVPILATPTFNLNPVGANTSFGTPEPGVNTDPLTRHEQVLTEEQHALIAEECGELYERVLAAKRELRAATPAPRSPA